MGLHVFLGMGNYGLSGHDTILMIACFQMMNWVGERIYIVLTFFEMFIYVYWFFNNYTCYPSNKKRI